MGAVSDVAFVVEAEVALDRATDPRAVGAAVTVELCGHWEHEGRCRWPHHTGVEGTRHVTVVVAGADEAGAIGARVERAFREGGAWRALAVAVRPVGEAERELAGRLLAYERAATPPA
jgi:hypothetical protein